MPNASRADRFAPLSAMPTDQLESPMIADTLRERLGRDPFEPFRVLTGRGRSVLVARPDLAVLMRSQVFIAAPNSDRWAQIPYLQVSGIATAPPTRRKRRS